jgi:hypothetical protein
MIVPTFAFYKLAYSKYAIGASNMNNLVQILGLFKGKRVAAGEASPVSRKLTRKQSR